MKPLISRILSLQLLIEQELLPKIEAEAAWNTNFFTYTWDHYLTEKHRVRKLRQREAEEAALGGSLDIPDP